MTQNTRRHPTGGRRTTKLSTLVAICLMLTVAASGPGDAEVQRGDLGAPNLAPLRRATVKYQQFTNAIAEGYQLGNRGTITGCIEHPSDGAMGYHFFNAELIEDLVVDPLRPEGLVYTRGGNGRLRLAAVEWVVPQDRPGRPGVTTAPTVLNQELHIINEDLGWYIAHAWIWDPNPSGMFSDWNPDVVCPDDVEVPAFPVGP